MTLEEASERLGHDVSIIVDDFGAMLKTKYLLSMGEIEKADYKKHGITSKKYGITYKMYCYLNYDSGLNIHFKNKKKALLVQKTIRHLWEKGLI